VRRTRLHAAAGMWSLLVVGDSTAPSHVPSPLPARSSQPRVSMPREMCVNVSGLGDRNTDGVDTLPSLLVMLELTLERSTHGMPMSCPGITDECRARRLK